MQNSKTKFPFRGTKDQEITLLDIIAKYKSDPGGIIPVLQEAQKIYGYLPIEVQKIIAKGLDRPLEEVYGVVTFYSQFSLNPKGKNKITVCMGTACYVRKAGEILERLEKAVGVKSGECTEDRLFSLDACRCIGACGLAPVFLVNDDVYGRIQKPKDVDAIVDKYRE
jgi:NADH:ubiquinone oxidoreductase subunit E